MKSKTNTLLTRYAAFLSQNITVDTSFLTTMKNIVNTAFDIQKPTNITSGNINFQSTQNGDTTRLQWFYTDNTPITNYKIVEMDFTKGNLVSFW